MSLATSIGEKLRKSSLELLDISTRNRLISTPRTRARSTSIEIIEGNGDEVYARLVRDKKSLTFVPGREDDSERENDEESISDPYHLAQPEDDGSELDNLSRRRRSDGVQTRLTSEVLQRRLLRLYHDAHTYKEEQGVNILFLAIGFLKWYEAPNSDQPRYAPLLLLPVGLKRESSRSRFKISAIEEEISTNLSLKEKLKEFSITLPDVPEIDDDELRPSEYFEEVRNAVAGQPRWEVLSNDIVLWFFSFTKFLMYRDLQPENWPEDCTISNHGPIASLFGDGFHADPPLCGDEERVDPLCPPEQTTHIVDADSSQALAIEEVHRGRHLVIQGPPGTGKSQTIANLIAAAVKEGRRVLFVAEKLAALEVVKSRLDRCGLGAICLELHSNKANKKAVLANLAETLEARRPRLADLEEHLEQLRQLRERLNQHVETLHKPFGAAHYTPFFLIGQLVRLTGKGVPPCGFRLTSALQWTDRQVKEKAAILRDVVLHLTKVGVPEKHPWRGVNLSALLPTERQRIVEKVSAIAASLDRLLHATAELAKSLSYQLFPSATQVSTLARLALHLSRAPEADASAIADPIWIDKRAGIANLVEQGETYAALRDRLAGVVEEHAWDTEVSAPRGHLSLRGRSWFRWFYRDYRAARRTLDSICVEQPPRTLKEQIEVLDELIAGQRARKTIANDDVSSRVGRRAFGTCWNGTDSDWLKLKAIVHWAKEAEEKKLPPTYRQLLSAVCDARECSQLMQKIGRDLKPALGELTALFQELALDLVEAFGTSELNSISLVDIKERLELWSNFPTNLEVWIGYRTRWRRLQSEQLEELAKLIAKGVVSPAIAVDQFYMATYEQIVGAVYREYPHLAEFDGQSHEELIHKFQEMDRKRIELARLEVAVAHYQGIPRGGADIGEMAVVRNEIQKQRRHLPIRQLLKKAGRAIQAIKPVFMMSPISIAQFLEPGAFEFDLLLIDEASQVRPVDALGAIARAKQMVVVGDDKQLPPTMFFEKLTGNVEATDDEQDDAQTGDLESLLGLCLARGLVPPRMLKWHYRSRHHTLIAVSNKEFYANNLTIIPSPEETSPTLGLRFRHVPDGVFDRGRTATNRKEARAIAAAVIEHARKNPELSLGVGAFSVAQRDAIIDELELLMRDNPDVDRFFSSPREEPFFVKNLESLQGDERDVIFISVGYARDESGFFAMAFGPLAQSGGERRLNVLISRAKRRCEVFSSIKAEDIDLYRARSRGAAALKTFLKYAETGILDVGSRSDRECDSEFEIEVKRSLEQHGLELDMQVGVAGFFIDLAIKDPEQPGRYLLGIECDGATYHQSRSARDRDRLRQQVLVDRGWAIHRIWSSDWFKNPEEQVKRVLRAVEDAKARCLTFPDGYAPSATVVATPDNSSTEADSEDEEGPQLGTHSFEGTVTPYREAELRARTDQPLHDIPVAGLSQVAVHVVQVEGPIHRAEVARRIAAFWGHQRVSSRMDDAVQRALDYAVSRGILDANNEFYLVRGQRDIPIRNRESVISRTLRNPEMLPPDEIRRTVLHIIECHLGAEGDEIVAVASRLLGFRTTSQKIRQRITDTLRELLREGQILQKENRLYAG